MSFSTVRTITRRTIPLVVVTVAVLGSARADSLWKPTNTSAFADRKALKVGDLITIVISESSSASQQATTAVSTSSKVSGGPGTGPVLNMIPGLKFSGTTDAKNTGSTSRSATLTASITAKITQVNDNGNLVIEGTRDVKANAETQTVKISGVVRPDDVSPDNTVQSTAVADAKIEYTGKGPIAERQKPGIVTRLFKLLF